MEIPDIKSQLTLLQVLAHYGLQPDKHGKMNCPFHEDKTPSMQVYEKTQTCYCFSSNCPTHGKALDVIDFIMYMEKSSKHEAIVKAQGFITHPQPPLPLSREVFLTRMFTSFKNGVYHAKSVQAYITSRSLDFNVLEIGYNGGQFHHGSRKDETLLKNSVAYGLLKPTHHTNARDKETYTYMVFGRCCLVFALKNKAGYVSGMYFRSVVNHTDKKHYYLQDRQGLYPGYPNAETKKLILTEAIIDAASLLQVEAITTHYSILSCYGTNGFTEEHTQAIRSLKQLEEIIFFFDGDEAGQKAVAKYTPMLKAAYPNLKITCVDVPRNEDVNSLLQGHSADLLIHLLDTRKEDFIFSLEKLTEEEKPLAIEAPVQTETAPVPEAIPAGVLNTSNPYSLKYQGKQAAYQIKGFKIDALDSLKITLQITVP